MALTQTTMALTQTARRPSILPVGSKFLIETYGTLTIAANGTYRYTHAAQ